MVGDSNNVSSVILLPCHIFNPSKCDLERLQHPVVWHLLRVENFRFLFFRHSPFSFLFSLFIILFHFLFCIRRHLFEMQAVIWTISRVVICPSKMNTKCSPLSCRAMLDIELVLPATCHKFFLPFTLRICLVLQHWWLIYHQFGWPNQSFLPYFVG